MRIPENKIEEISSSVDIVDVVSEYVSLNRKGDRYWGCCPFHNEKTPSFTVTPSKNLYYCFGCGASGSIFTFLMNIENITFVESVEKLAQKAHIEIGTYNEYYEKDQKDKNALLDLNNRVAGSYHYILLENKDGKEALDYIKNDRLVTEEVIKKFKIGYAPKDRHWLFSFLKNKSYSSDFLNKTGLFSKKYPQVSFFSHRIIFPIHNRMGNVIGFGGRQLEESGPKYLNSAENDIFHKSKELFGLFFANDAIRKERNVYLVEGYFDVISLHCAGVENVVAPLGTSFTEDQAKILKRMVSEIKILFDSDLAGQNAAIKAASLCESLEIKNSIIVFEGGKDPAEVLKKEGQEALKKKIKYSINTVEYLISMMHGLSSKRNSEEWWEKLKTAFAYIKQIQSEIQREEAIKYLSNGIGVSEEALRTDYNKFSNDRGNKQRHIPRTKHISNNSKHINKDDRFLVFLVLAKPELFKVVRRDIVAEDIIDDEVRESFLTFEEAFRIGTLTLDLLIEQLPSSDLREEAIRKSAQGEFEVNPEKIIHDIINRIKLRSIKKKRSTIEDSLEKVNDFSSDQALQLLQEKMFLDSEIEKLKVRANGGTAE
ncbi:DNA primase [Spirochaeta cellobiosiphila]|uniref:DNA primase n=1 Tax=Spirochaeta cellobiosiphila TaxID=504483 RepID=UPI00048F40E9|nr:DNA primase [Spirochaeta cellobiosiphila]